MMSIFRCAVAIIAALSISVTVAAEPLTVAKASDVNGVIEASLAPDGRSVAMIVFDGVRHHLLFHFPVTGAARGFALQGYEIWAGDRELRAPFGVTWAGNDLLALDYGNLVISVDRRGRLLVDNLGKEVIRRAARDDEESPWLLVYTDNQREQMALVHARSGERKILQRPPGILQQTAFDRQGYLRAVTVLTEGAVPTYANWYLPAPGGTWQKLATFGATQERWEPAYVPNRPHTLAVRSRIGRDTYAYFYYDTERGEMGEMLAGHPSEDILGVVGVEGAAYERVTTGGMRTEEVWLNGTWAGVQQAVDAVLPGRSNRLSGNPRGNVLVYSSSDVVPGEWHLLDTKSSTLVLIGRRRSALERVDMRPMEIIRYPADDGLSIPAFLTRPADGARGTPLVVLIHGGPWVRDYWTWNEEVQLLAAHGYAVLQPQFRGSSGFGKRFEQAGYGQWGRAMQDDITAGVRKLIADGTVDPRRICIVGASYGGYAALWGLAKTPELYRCGISLAGVTDIEHMFHDDSDAARSDVARAIRLHRIGDVTDSAERFDQVSPLKQVDRIQAPVLLVHGEADQRVPISHALKMKEALERLGKPVQWLSLKDAGHSLSTTGQVSTYYRTMLEFLDKHIGPAAQVAR